MTRLIIYLAHCVAPTAEEIAAACATPSLCGQCGTGCGGRAAALQSNINRALSWLSWLRRSFPETTFIAPWIVGLMSGEDDADPAARERGLVDCCAVVERCDGIVLVGPRISSGMARERDRGLAHGLDDSTPEDPVQTFAVYDLTSVFQESIVHSKWAHSERGPGTCPITFVEWAEIFLG